MIWDGRLPRARRPHNHGISDLGFTLALARVIMLTFGCVEPQQRQWVTLQHDDMDRAQRDEYECRVENTYMPAPMMLYGPLGGGALGVPLQGEPQLNYTSYSKCMGIRGYTLQ